ncbi:MAG: hypothetical protein KGZ37_00655 [Nitrosarchaeum sp.]|nr:hypothetical protein [Nitrosarchaeum sp.]
MSEIKKEQSTIYSLRLKNSIKTKLELESELHNVNTNTLVNQILTKYLEWDRYSKDIGSVYITKRFLRGVLGELSEQKIITIASTISAPSLKDAVVFMHEGFNYTNIIKTVKAWLENSDYQFRHTSDLTDKFIIHHGMGKKWTIYFTTMLSTLLKELNYGLKDMVVTDDSICFTITKF